MFAPGTKRWRCVTIWVKITISGEWIMYTFVTAIPLKPTVWSNVCRNRPRRHGYACLAGVDDPLAGRPYWPVSDQWAVWSVGAACGPLRHDHSNLLARRTEETTMGEGARYVDDLTSNVNIDLARVLRCVHLHRLLLRLLNYA